MFTTIYVESWFNWSEVPTKLLGLLALFLCLKFKQQYDTKLRSSAIGSSLTETSSSSNSRATDKNKHSQHNLKSMPTPTPWPILGHIHLLRDHQHNPWDGFDLIRQKYGDVVSLKMGIHPMVLVSSCESMREILLKKGDIFSNRPNFPRHHIIFGGDKENSLALCNWSNTHRDRRKLCKRGIVPNKFSSRNQLLEDIISKKVLSFLDNLDQIDYSYPDNSKTQYKLTKENLLFLTSNVFMDFLCAENHSYSKEEYRKFIYGCDFVFWDINQSYLIDFLPYLTTLGVGYSYLRRLKKVTDFLRDYIDEKIFEPRLKKHQLQAANQDCNSFQATNFTKTSVDDMVDSTLDEKASTEDYLDTLITEYLSKETSMSLADYKVGFADLLAGHAAVANILVRLLGHLALDEKIQDMICKEAEEANIQSLSHKPSLPITEAAMQEALRIASSPIVPHVAREDTSINDFFVPQDTMVLFNVHHLNLSEDLWRSPYQFDPTRFLKICDEEGRKIFKLDIPKHFIPFSVGMRQCLGQKMVETLTIVLVANLCRRFIIRSDNDDLVRKLLTPKGSIALNPDAKCFEFKLYPRS